MMNEAKFEAFAAAANAHCGAELSIEWDGESDEVTIYAPLSPPVREAIDAIASELAIALVWE
jgi:hypothetical protein